MKRSFIVVGCLIAGVCVLLVAFVVASLVAIDPHVNDPSYVPTPVTVYPSSIDLQQSVIVPTMDTEMQEGKNVIWCASFQLAWDRLGDDVLHAPPIIAHAEVIAEQLNRNKFSQNDIPNSCYLALAGLCREGIVKRIDAEMQQRFQRVPTIAEISDPTNAIVAYSCLEAGIPFQAHYFENSAPVAFKDGKGNETNIMSFGANFSQTSINQRLCKQVMVLYSASNDTDGSKMVEFVIDPCRESSPNQVILARIPPGKTLQTTWSNLQKRMADYSQRPNADERFTTTDELLIPSMAWDITHHFTELEGPDKLLKNASSAESVGKFGLWEVSPSW